MSSGRYCQNRSEIASERFDDGLVIINFLTGRYFSMNGTGEAVWYALATPASRDELGRTLASMASAPAPEQVQSDLDRFLDVLIEHRLLLATDTGPPCDQAVSGPYEAPIVEVFDELSDLILLDPIHEVSEAVGWPVPPEQASAP